MRKKVKFSRVGPNFIFSDFEKLDTFASGFLQFCWRFRWWKELVIEDYHPHLNRLFFNTLGSEARKVQYSDSLMMQELDVQYLDSTSEDYL